MPETDWKARAECLEHAIREAANWGWCRESREILWGAIEDDQERIQAAVDSSAGLVAEALSVLDLVMELRQVRDLADALVTSELRRRNGLRGNLRNVDWAPLIDALRGAARAEENADIEAFRREAEAHP